MREINAIKKLDLSVTTAMALPGYIGNIEISLVAWHIVYC